MVRLGDPVRSWGEGGGGGRWCRGGWVQGSDYSLKVGRRVDVELTEVRRHKSAAVVNEVRVPKATPAVRNLPPHHSAQLRGVLGPGTLMSGRGRSASTFPLYSPNRTKFLRSFLHSKVLRPLCARHCAPTECHWTAKLQVPTRQTKTQTLWC